MKEEYFDERVAEFLLTSAIDESDYQAAREEVRKLGLDPDHVRHVTPTGMACGLQIEMNGHTYDCRCDKCRADKMELIAQQAVLVAYSYRDDGRSKEWLTEQLLNLQERIQAARTPERQ